MVGPEQSHSVEYESSDYVNIHTVCGTQFSSPTVVEQWLELPLGKVQRYCIEKIMVENINNIMMEEIFIYLPSEQILLKAVSRPCRGQLLIYPNFDISVKLLTEAYGSVAERF
ncbi:hypothetical protein CEXT_20011 [Caerostris extrusa]|uniref:Uncharacterized protein n=1 Tax=Caerostris extrusa TaxID=172846 RepID=A0AAV4W638_CAEEX|nr:hypothetical protein CEXT_20011 [Caerostris extrusa]